MNINVMRVQLVKERELQYGAIAQAGDVAELLFKMDVDKNAEEVFGLVCCDSKGDVIGIHEVSRGTINTCQVHPREVFKRALLNNANSVVLFHNHPSGDPAPSEEDIDVTKRMMGAGDILGVKVLDHVIVGDGSYFSFCGNGLM